jgi:sec-independent protein translocase protein TatA
MHLGFPEIIAVLLIILLLFGPGRIEKLASEMGKGIRSFRDGMQGNKEDEEDKPEQTTGEEVMVEKQKKKKKKKEKDKTS